MEDEELNRLLGSFEDLPDPRSERNQVHPLLSIIFIAICGAISGADNWVDIEAYGNAKAEWLKTMIALPQGIPSHDTFGRVFRFMNPHAFQERFLSWVHQIGQVGIGEVVAMDGKQMRGTKDVPAGKDGLYMVSAWAVEQGIVLEHILKLLGATREKKLNRGQVDKSFGAGKIAFIILAQTPRATQPSKSTFDDPSKRKDFKSFRVGITLNNLQNCLNILAYPL